jgi:hypothetical protein
MTHRRARVALAGLLALAAVAVLVAEPFPKGTVLVSLTERHGIDVGDLPSPGLLLVAGSARNLSLHRAGWWADWQGRSEGAGSAGRPLYLGVFDG